jgi:DNA-binding SARP family transcriptional activator
VTIAATGHQEGSRRDARIVPRASLRLVAEFQLLVEGRAVTLPHSVERIVAFLGMNRSPVNRARLAASLWPDVPDHRANGDLRSALWRLRRVTGVLRERDNRLALAPEVDVDIVELSELTHTLIDEPSTAALGRLPDLVRGHDILPGWDEEWLVVERERYRLLRLRAMERSAEALLTAGDHSAALDAALACVATEPYRESAHRLVIQIHLAEGNNAEAFRAYQRYRSLLFEELGILPSLLMDDLIAPIQPRRGR